MREFDLISRIRERVASRDDVVLGIGDDAALLLPPAGMQLVVAMDTLNEGVHFPAGTAPSAIGWKALAVNLSDLAAMGATPAWCTLSLSLPEPHVGFVDGFLDGFLQLAQQHDVALIGGDTTRGPLSVCVTAHGFVAPGQALCRDGARVGDEVWVSGTLGDAAAALLQWQSGGAVDAELRDRLDRPTPRLVLGRALRDIASACIDVSDGLLADLAHVCKASGVGAEVDAAALPASDALLIGFDRPQRRAMQTAGGDDYELCFTAPPSCAAKLASLQAETRLTRIGRITAGQTVQAHDAADAGWQPAATGYQHFG